MRSRHSGRSGPPILCLCFDVHGITVSLATCWSQPEERFRYVNIPEVKMERSLAISIVLSAPGKSEQVTEAGFPPPMHMAEELAGTPPRTLQGGYQFLLSPWPPLRSTLSYRSKNDPCSNLFQSYGMLAQMDHIMREGATHNLYLTLSHMWFCKAPMIG